MGNDVANLRASLKGIQDGEFGLRLSVFATVVFLLTLVASIFSMGDNYLAGKSRFWVFWACSVPLVAVFAMLLIYGKRPWRAVEDLQRMFKIGQEQDRGANRVKFEAISKEKEINGQRNSRYTFADV